MVPEEGVGTHGGAKSNEPSETEGSCNGENCQNRQSVIRLRYSSVAFGKVLPLFLSLFEILLDELVVTNPPKKIWRNGIRESFSKPRREVLPCIR
jgi:hypothetical protein